MYLAFHKMLGWLNEQNDAAIQIELTNHFTLDELQKYQPRDFVINNGNLITIMHIHV